MGRVVALTRLRVVVVVVVGRRVARGWGWGWGVVGWSRSSPPGFGVVRDGWEGVRRGWVDGVWRT